jgi:ComEC/Rec2-related protein
MAGPQARVEEKLDERAGYHVGPLPAVPQTLEPALAQPDSPARLPADWPQARVLSVLRSLPAKAARAGPAVRAALTTELDRGTPFLFVPVFMAAGALVYFASGSEPAFATVAASVAVLALLTRLARSRLVLHLALSAVLCFALGVLFGQVETWRAGTKVLGGEISTRLTGRVVAIEEQASGRIRLTLDVLETERPKLRYSPDRVRVSARSVPEGLRAGEVVAGIARLAAPSGPTRPGGYDFSFESYFDGIGASGFYLKQPERVADVWPTTWSTRFFATVENLRGDLADRIRAAIGGAEGEIAAALVAGVRAGIPDDVNESLRRTGLAHVLSISGLHMALVAATIMFVLRGGFALFPGFASRRPVKKYAAGAGLVALAAYLFLSGSAVAAERSFLMLGVMLLAVIFDRAALTMRNLAIAAIVIIAVSPHEAAGPSFQMSFAATAGLIGAYAAWSRRRSRRPAPPVSDAGIVGKAGRKAGSYVIGLVATSLIAGTATAVFGAYHFQRVSALGLAANLVAMPIVSVLVMPFALLGIILMPFGLDGWAFAVMGEGLKAMIAVSEWFSAMSPIDGVGLIPAGAVLVLTVALVLATLPTTWLRLTAIPVAIIGILMIAGRTLPDVLISEDGRLVAVRCADGVIAVNRRRPNAFTTEDWQRALASASVVKPANVSSAELAKPAVDKAAAAFRCADDACIAITTAGALVVHANSAAAAAPLCATASLIVIDDATATSPCPSNGPVVVTKRDLARHGAAAVHFASGIGKPSAEVTYAIDEPYRPWHTQRGFSREARGLAPRQPKSAGQQPKGDTSGTSSNTQPANSAADTARATGDSQADGISSGGSSPLGAPAP